ncbi:MAG: cupin protein, partial [Caulobacteraceae bacterium]|nr:cupin protein [Caulobacteraceae bacterium]
MKSMKSPLLLGVSALVSAALLVQAAAAQNAAPTAAAAAAAPAAGGRGGGGGGGNIGNTGAGNATANTTNPNCPPNYLRASGGNPVNEPPSNAAVGVNIDRYIGDPDKQPAGIYRNAMMTKPILTMGDPANGQGAHDGAVLRYHHDVSLNTMAPGEETDLEPLAGQQLIYVEDGAGRLDDGNLMWDIRKDLVILVPGNHPTRFINTGDKPLVMLNMTDLPHPEVTPIPDIVVRDPAKVEYVEQGAHWANLSKGPFNDYNVRFLLVYMAPMSIAGPHAHDVPTEEGWVKITDGDALMNMGSELRTWKKNVGIIAPNTCATVHGAINNTDTVQAWFYFAATGAPARAPGAAAGGGGRGGAAA